MRGKHEVKSSYSYYIGNFDEKGRPYHEWSLLFICVICEICG